MVNHPKPPVDTHVLASNFYIYIHVHIQLQRSQGRISSPGSFPTTAWVWSLQLPLFYLHNYFSRRACVCCVALRFNCGVRSPAPEGSKEAQIRLASASVDFWPHPPTPCTPKFHGNTALPALPTTGPSRQETTGKVSPLHSTPNPSFTPPNTIRHLYNSPLHCLSLLRCQRRVCLE